MHALFLLIHILIATSCCAVKKPLKVVTIESPPFISQDKDGKLKGFCIDLLDEIKAITGYTFDLYITPDQRYGVEYQGKWNGMIAQIERKAADLAIGDLIVTEARQRAITFTTPFFHVFYVGLLQKDLTKIIKSIDHLVNQTEMAYGIIRDGPTERFLANSKDPIIERMYSYLRKHDYNNVNSFSQGVDRVRNGNYVFLGEAPNIEYVVANECDLSMLGGGSHDWLTMKSYSIAVEKKNLMLIKQLNSAITELHSNGKLKQLKTKWWTPKDCKAK